MNRVTDLVTTPAVALRRFDHAPGVAHRDPERERAVRHGINFVETGSFRVRTGGPWRTVDGDALFVTTPGLEFSCAHDEECPTDCCLSVGFAEETVESARAWTTLSATAVRRLTNRRAYLAAKLRECGCGDEARLDGLAGALLWSLAERRSGQPLFRRDRLAWYTHRVDRAKALIDARYAEPLSLATLARDAGMSLFHFARVFAELEGRPPHRYLRDVRLTSAAARLRAGAGVTDTCYAVGFGSLSHFATSFRQRFGKPPSAFR